MTKNGSYPKTKCAYNEIIKKMIPKNQKRKNPEQILKNDAIKIPRDFFCFVNIISFKWLLQIILICEHDMNKL